MKKQRQILLLAVLLIPVSMQAQQFVSIQQKPAVMQPKERSIIQPQKPVSIIPLPVEVKATGSEFCINKNTVIYIAGNISAGNAIAGNTVTAHSIAAHASAANTAALPAKLLSAYLAAENTTGIKIVTKKPAANYIQLQVDSTKLTKPEGYRLIADKAHIEITAHDPAGIIYGIQTLRQLWQQKKGTVPGTIITDYPRFGYRGMALDVSRHIFPVSFIKKYIDLLSFYKYNTFHWHLTDDQGWRIEIKQYPRLQTIAAWRKETLIGHKKELPHLYDGKRYGGYYTQEEVKDIVQYATQRNITIIPEIEMPGHALAALSAYPSLGCTGGPYQAATFWGVFDDVYCAGNDNTFTFLQHVLDEVVALFPAHYIHIGGDECPKTAWKACPKCQQRLKQLNLPDEHALQSYFIQRIEKYVNTKGRDIIGWDEILEGGLAPNATVMSWRGEEGGIAAASQQHRFIMTPETYVYFDYYQSLEPTEPVAAGNYTPLKKVYNYEPAGRLTDSMLPYMAGVEGQAWSEYYTSEAQAMYMIFPRAIALAEAAWTPAAQRNYEQFLVRLRTQQPMLKGYDKKEYQPPVTLHKAINASVTLSAQPVERFNPGKQVLVNGIQGNTRYNDGQWIGFNTERVTITLDLKTVQNISSIKLNILNYHWQRIWQPEQLEILVAYDTMQYKSVHTQRDFPVNGVNTVTARVNPVTARYIKIIAHNKSVIPVGEYGAGGKPLLMIDEIMID